MYWHQRNGMSMFFTSSDPLSLVVRIMTQLILEGDRYKFIRKDLDIFCVWETCADGYTLF